MQIHQFNMQFNPEHDRLIFRLNTTAHEEFRFSLTRRFVKLLWPVLIQLLEKEYKQREPEKSHLANVLLPYEHQEVVSKADFSKPYAEEDMIYPLGEEPMLLSRIQIKQGSQGDILCLLPTNGSGIELGANPQFIHTFCKLLRDVISRSDWDMDFIFVKQAESISQAPQKRVLH